MKPLSSETPHRAYMQSLSALIRPQIGLPIDYRKTSISKSLADFAVHRHRVGPLLYMASKENSNVDNSASSTLSRSYKKNIHSHLAQKAALRNLEVLLKENDIPFSVVKGLGLANQIYNNPELRCSKDIDILISPSASRLTIQLLDNNGYLHIPFTVRSKLSNKLKHKLSDITLFKDLNFRDPKFSVIIELHERLFKVEPKTYTADFNRALKYKNIPSITDSHYCLYIILHGAGCYWSRLKWVMDLSLLVRTITVQERLNIMKLAKSYGSDTALIASLIFVEEVFEGSLDKDWENILGEQRHTKEVQGLKSVFWKSLLSTSPDRPNMPEKKSFFSHPATAIFVNQISILRIVWSRFRLSFVIRFF